MGSIISAVTGSGGMAFKPDSANILNPATVDQANTQYANANQGLTNQSNFLAALQAQNGVQNQSSVFNQLQGVANGTGPNPAQAMLNQSTGQNVANQAALMAGQRGSGANAGLMARQAAQQGANTQQQAIGQGASMQAQQSLGALNQLGGIAGTQVAQQGGATNAYSTAAQGEQSNILGAINNQNQANVSMQNNMNTTNASVASQTAQAQGNLLGSLTGGLGTALPGMMSSVGGLFSGGAGGGAAMAGAGDALSEAAPLLMLAAEGGNVEMPPMQHAPKTDGPRSKVGQHFHSSPQYKPMMAQGGQVPAMVSKGEQYLNPKDVEKVKQGASPLAVGERIPGKPQFPGNDYRNDVVPKTLEEGGLVIPNKIMQSKNPEAKAAKFVAAHLKSQALKKGK